MVDRARAAKPPVTTSHNLWTFSYRCVRTVVLTASLRATDLIRSIRSGMPRRCCGSGWYMCALSVSIRMVRIRAMPSVWPSPASEVRIYSHTSWRLSTVLQDAEVSSHRYALAVTGSNMLSRLRLGNSSSPPPSPVTSI